MKLKLLNDMMIFVKVVDLNSFTGAAADLGISKSAISKYINRLESNLGAQLLHRSTRRLVPTEAGRILYESFARICDDLEDAEAAVSYTNMAPRGTLHIAAPISFANLHLVSAIKDFMSIYTEMKVEVSHGLSYEDFVGSGSDLLIHIGELPDINLVARQITMRGLRVCASPEYLEQHGVPETPEDLVNHNCLCYEGAPYANEWVFTTQAGPLRVKVKGNFAARAAQTLEAAAVAGLGVVMLPSYMMSKDVQAGKLVQLLDDFCPRNIGIYAIYPYTRHLPPKIRVFIDFVVERFGDEAYWRRSP